DPLPAWSWLDSMAIAAALAPMNPIEPMAIQSGIIRSVRLPVAAPAMVVAPAMAFTISNRPRRNSGVLRFRAARLIWADTTSAHAIVANSTPYFVGPAPWIGWKTSGEPVMNANMHP